MRFLEFGVSYQKIMLLIHGMQTPWQLWREHIEFFSHSYRVIVPVLSGHDTEEQSNFISILEEVKSIEEHILTQSDNKVFAVCGISMGGAISALLWERKKIRIDKLFLDGAPLLPYSVFIERMIEMQYKYVTLKTKKRSEKILEKCQKEFIPPKYMKFFLRMIDKMSDETIENCVKSVANFRLCANCCPDIQLAYIYGTKANEYYSKKSAKFLRKFYPMAEVICLEGYSHTELFLFFPQEHIRLINEFIQR